MDCKAIILNIFNFLAKTYYTRRILMKAIEESTSEKILNEAITLFKKNGYEQTTINEICSKAGVTKRAFYYHFKSKEELISKFYKDLYSYDKKDLASILRKANYWEQIWEMYSVGIDQTILHGHEILSQILKINLNSSKGTFESTDFFDSILFPLIQKAQVNGEIQNNSDPKILSACSQSIIIGIAAKWCMNNGDFDEKREILKAFECLYCVREDLRISIKP